jgi:hypothetical protein
MKTLTNLFPLPNPDFSFAGFTWPRVVGHLPLRNLANRKKRYQHPLTSRYYHAPKPIDKDTQGIGFYLGCKTGGQSIDLRIESIHDSPFDSSRTFRYTGWFADIHEHDTIYGIVAKLPSSKGNHRFLAGYTFGEGMIAYLDRDIHSDIDDAVLAADNLAEHYSQLCRDDSYNESLEEDELLQA